MKNKIILMSKNWHNFLIPALLLALICFTYRGIDGIFFQNDEWASIGFVQADGLAGAISTFTPFELLMGKGRVLGTFFNNLMYYVFPFNISVYASSAVILHWFNSLLVYGILLKLTKHRLSSILGAIFFAVGETPSQTITWIAAYTTALPNALLILSALYAFLIYKEKQDTRYLHVCFALFIVGYYFKESSTFLMLILPLIDYITASKKEQAKQIIIRYLPIFFFFFFIGVIRLIQIYRPSGDVIPTVSKGENALAHLVLHVFLYPVVGAFQLFMPSQLTFKVADAISSLLYGFMDANPSRPAIVMIIVSDALAVYGVLIGSLCLGLLRSMDSWFKKYLYLPVVFIFLALLPITILNRFSSSYFDSRYYYLGSIGAALLVGFIYKSADNLFASFRSRGLYEISLLGLVLVLCFYFYKQSVFVQRSMNLLVHRSEERKTFLNNLSITKENTPDKPIFYIEGDSPGYYGYADLMVPFQQGMGYTTMVWLFDTGKIPESLLRSSFLWNINEQGYEEADSKGFGYFYQKTKLVELFQANASLTPEQIVAYRYKTGSRELIDITDSIRNEILSLQYE